MSEKQNIEDLFRTGFDEYKVNPTEKVWSGINKKMAGPRFEALYRNAFNGFKVSPSEQIWRRVAAVIWFNKFIHFTPFSFNIYYLAIISTAIIGTVVTVNNNPNLNFVHFDQESIIPEVAENDTVSLFDIAIPDKMSLETPTIENNSDLSLISNNTNTVKEQAVVKNTAINSSKSGKTTRPANSTNNTATTTAKTNNQVITTSPVIVKDQDITESSTDIALANINQTNDAQVLPINIETTNPNTSETDVKDKLISIENSFVVPLRIQTSQKFKLTYRPLWTDLADFAFVGLPEREVIVYDTIGYNYLGQPVVVEKSWFGVDLFFTPYICNYNSVLLNNELESNYEFYSKNIKPGFSYSAGLGFSYNYNHFRIETGVSYHRINENISQNLAAYDTITCYDFEYFENEAWDYDTTMILDLDEYIQGNIVYIPYVDSTLIVFTDSVQIPYLDSVLNNKLVTAANAYHIIDIPLIAGYEFTYGNLSVTPKAGIITSILIDRSGTAFNLLNREIQDASAMPDNKLIFDYYAALNLQYKITKHTSIFVEPHIRGDINSMYNSTYAISEKSRKYGIKTGISYKF